MLLNIEKITNNHENLKPSDDDIELDDEVEKEFRETEENIIIHLNDTQTTTLVYSQNNMQVEDKEKDTSSNSTRSKERKDKYGVDIKKRSKSHKVSFNDSHLITVIKVDNYKKYNDFDTLMFYENFNEIPKSCNNCKIF